MKRTINNGESGIVRLLIVITGMALLASLGGCGQSSGALFSQSAGPRFNQSGGGGDFGATQGGVQDMGLARELIENGQVPPPEAFTVEGMFSEHDLPLTGAPCSRLLCLRRAMGIAPTLEGESSGWLQVGMSSTINPDAFERPSLTLIATVDVSGSMGWDYSSEETEYPTPGALARKLLTAVAARLGSEDRFAIVTYGSDVDTLLDLARGDDSAAIGRAIQRLTTNGSTNMEAGLRRAYDIARGAEKTSDQIRIMLFTDMQPNVGATSATEFETMAKAGADEGIGLTVMGVGLGLGQEVLNAMVHLRGGNAFSLFESDDVEKLMEDSWPWMVSPIAYGLSVQLNPCTGFEVADTYGFPGEQEEGASLDVATVFLSKRKGALLMRLLPKNQMPLSALCVDGTLAYETPEGKPVAQDLNVAYPNGPLDERMMVFEQPSVGKTVALAILVSNMKRAAEVYGQDQQEAVDIMKSVVDRFAMDAEALGDEALQPEVELARKLLDLMEKGAEQGDFYGQRF